MDGQDYKENGDAPTVWDAIIEVTERRVVYDREIMAQVVAARKKAGAHRHRACGIVNPGFPVRYEDYAEGRYDD